MLTCAVHLGTASSREVQKASRNETLDEHQLTYYLTLKSGGWSISYSPQSLQDP
jgi:hypothetical protein